MAGELWRSVFQIGKEAVAGTAVAATRKLYVAGDSGLTRSREARPKRLLNGRRDNVLDVRRGPMVAGGKLAMPMSADEVVELLLMGLKGSVAPTQPDPVGNPTVYLWTFTPDANGALDTATVEAHDGANAWRVTGALVDSLTISGSVDGEHTVAAELLARNHERMAGGITAALADRVPSYIEGWETKVYLDNLGAVPGTTVIPGFLTSWEVKVGNNGARHYFADNTQAAGDVNLGQLDVEATFTFKASAAQAITELTNADAATDRLVRLEFGQNELISGAYKRFVTLDIPGSWSAEDLGQDADGIRVYQFSLQYLYDATNGFGFRVRAQNNRSAAY